ncbi:MAG: hypothetical protein ACE5HA_15425 [Anaerolineae bacterium]
MISHIFGLQYLAEQHKSTHDVTNRGLLMDVNNAGMVHSFSLQAQEISILVKITHP